MLKLTFRLTLIVPKYSATLFMQGGGGGHSGHKGTNKKANDQVLKEIKL